MHQFDTPRILHNQEQEYLATGTDDCSGNCPKTVHETVQNGANACEVHGRNRVPNKEINPAVVRGYASKCDALLKAGEAIRTPDIHVGNVIVCNLLAFFSGIIDKKRVLWYNKGGHTHKNATIWCINYSKPNTQILHFLHT
jgi:hypothetical protein